MWTWPPGEPVWSDECFNSLKIAMVEQIGKLATQKLAEAQAENDRLGEEAKLDDQERKTKAEEIRQQLSDWDEHRPLDSRKFWPSCTNWTELRPRSPAASV